MILQDESHDHGSGFILPCVVSGVGVCNRFLLQFTSSSSLVCCASCLTLIYKRKEKPLLSPVKLLLPKSEDGLVPKAGNDADLTIQCLTLKQ